MLEEILADDMRAKQKKEEEDADQLYEFYRDLHFTNNHAPGGVLKSNIDIGGNEKIQSER